MIRAVAAMLCMAAASAVPAEPIVSVLPDVPADCLAVVGETAPVYPEIGSDHPGDVVRVRMTFSDAESRPDMVVFTNTAGQAFEAPVTSLVQGYRFRCGWPSALKPTLVQEFQFLPGRERLVLTGAVRRSRSAERAPISCVPQIPPTPTYPYPGRLSEDRRESTGILVRLSFNASGEPPSVQLLNGQTSRFATTVRQHAAGYRIECSDPSRYPFTALIPYRFELDPPGYQFRPIELKTLLGLVAGLEKQRVRFDFHSMGCPFEVSYQVWQPELSNRAVTATGHEDDRGDFLRWLSSLRLDLPEAVRHEVVGQTIKVTVPCLILNLL